jgi:hypothetical protein
MKMGVCMSINVGNNQVAPEEEDEMDFIKDNLDQDTCCSCLKKIFCFLCL